MTGEERLQSVAEDESKVFVSDCRHQYLEVTAKLKCPSNVDTAVIVVGNSGAKKYLDACTKALQSHKVIMVASQGINLAKLVSVVEQVKQQSGRISQMNKMYVQLSLINPKFLASDSIKNVQIFFGDEIVGDKTESALREIKGHKVFEVPCMSIILSLEEVPKADFGDWTIQVKGQ
ncbi:CIC11C00000005147 [Sungouiella intermedia]|uniref:CIC11C00000005147 n=1 Tax=Sungouiella intermedia TaxID=45354 RepID=A0A1L0DF85_9ASCO|nr:CIC11C00000005147 [[Candida] intermedia]